jgi:uncharacterized damage-inducible protein DinB
MSQPALGAETTALLKYLNHQREHVLAVLEGVDEETLRRPILPSGWSCLAMVQHLALDVEQFWFRAIVAGDEHVIASLAGAPSAWDVGPETSAAAVFDTYRQEIERASEIIAATPLDSPPAWWPVDLFGNYRLHTVREIVLHVMTETASHTGHLDAARELIDGKLWMVLTD